ncbi:hypothetical protein D3C72_2098700 [compost metagenome]
MQEQNLRGNIAQRRFEAANHTGKDVIDDNRRNCCNQTDSRCQQCFCDAWRHNGQVGGLGLGDTDEAVHDAPNRTKQTNERGNRTDSRQITVTATHVTTYGSNATLQTEAGTLFNAFVIFTACGKFQLVLRFVH